MKKATQKKLFAPCHMSEDEYRNHPAVNKSTLWVLQKSPLHYQYACENPSQDTQALKMGRAIHEAVLQPEEYKTHYVAAPDVDRRTKEGKELYTEFLFAAGDKEILTASEYQEVSRIASAVWECKEAEELLTGCTMEKPLFWTHEDTGIECKCRVDAMRPGIMIDLKTSSDASTSAFSRDVFRYGYDVQAAHYVDGYHSFCGEFPSWFFIVVEKTAPYAVNVLHTDAGIIDYGFLRRDALLQRLKECRDSGIWEGYGKNELILPGYLEVE